MRKQIELSNEVATELAGSGDAVLRALEGHVACDLYLRGNVVTLDGEEEAVEAAAVVVRELADLVAQGHDIAPGTIAAVTGALDQHRSPAEMPEAELRGIVREAIAETGATSQKDLGQVMKATMARVAGRADGKRVSALAREELGA